MSEARHHSARSLRHAARARVRRHRRRRIAIVVAALCAVVVGGVAVANVLGNRAEDGTQPEAAQPACADSASLVVGASGEYLPVMQDVARTLASDSRPEGAPCLDVSVADLTPGTGGTVSVAAGTAGILAVPGAVPALSAAAEEAGLTARTETTVATTVAVVAMPQPLADAAGLSAQDASWADLTSMLLDPDAWANHGRPELGSFSISLSDPAYSGAVQADLAGLASGALGEPLGDLLPEDLSDVSVQGALFGLDRQVTRSLASQSDLLVALTSSDLAGDLVATTSAAFLDEQTVWAYNDADPTTRLVALYPEGSAVTLPVTWLPLEGASLTPEQSEAAAALGEYLTSTAGQEQLSAHGLRRVDGEASTVLTPERGVLAEVEPVDVSEATAGVLQVATGGWQRIENPGRFLAVIDVSGSMAEEVPGTGRTRLQFAQDAAIQRMRALPRGGEIGLWEFSTKLDGDTDYRELVPVGKVSEVINGRLRIDVLEDSVKGLTPQADTALYDTILAAFRSMREGYQPGEPNDIVLVTDGRNDDPGSVDLTTLLATIAAEQDSANPVRVLSIAYGTGADLDALGKIAEATGGKVYNSPNPAAIGEAFFQALSGA